MFFFRLRRWLFPRSTPLQQWEKDYIEYLLIFNTHKAYAKAYWLVNRRGYRLRVYTETTSTVVRWHFAYTKMRY